MAMQYCNAILQFNIALNIEVGGKMNNNGSVGITTVPLLTSFLLVGATASSVLFEGSDNIAMDAEQTLNDVLNEITTYLKIDSILGKYYTTEGIRSVERIVVFVKQFIQNSIDISELTIQLINNNDVVLLGYSGHTVESNSKSVFEHLVWEKTNNAFSVMVLLDKDRSLLDYNIMNEDTAVIVIQLPDQFMMANGEALTVSIIPAEGIVCSLHIETPSFHSSNIISFGEV
jgi:archaellin